MQLHGERSGGDARSMQRIKSATHDEPSSFVDELIQLRALALHQALQIREIDHRAKNSLQLAASMLLLQARTRSGAAAGEALERAVERLHALAEIHRASYQAQEFDEIPIRAWIGNLCHGLIFDAGVELDISCPDRCWPFRVAAPAGLFLGEAVTNACKHAFPARRGRILVTVDYAAHDAFSLSIADDGVGRSSRAANGLGSELLEHFAQQLGGALQRSKGLDGKGHCVSVAFVAKS